MNMEFRRRVRLSALSVAIVLLGLFLPQFAQAATTAPAAKAKAEASTQTAAPATHQAAQALGQRRLLPGRLAVIGGFGPGRPPAAGAGHRRQRVGHRGLVPTRHRRGLGGQLHGDRVR